MSVANLATNIYRQKKNTDVYLCLGAHVPALTHWLHLHVSNKNVTVVWLKMIAPLRVDKV